MSKKKLPAKQLVFNDKSQKPSRLTPVKHAPAKKKPDISPKHLDAFNIAATKVSHKVNEICKGLFKNYKEFQTNRLLRYPGPEMQLVYNCSDPHSGKQDLEAVAEYFAKQLKADQNLKPEYSQLIITWVKLPRYIQITITIINTDLYALYKPKIKNTEEG
jgi:hypothetical protein